MTAIAPAGPPPPPSAGSRQAWPPPPDQPAPAAAAQEDDPWASWYDKPRAGQRETPSATIPRVPPSADQGPWQYDAPGYGQQDGAAQQYQGNQPYPAGQPYAGTAQYDATQYAGPQQQAGPGYGGPQYGAPQYNGPQFGGPQHGGGNPYADPQFGGPQYPGQQYPGQQYPDGQYGDPQYADPRYGGPRPRGASRLSALRSRGPLIPIAAVGAVAVIVIVAVLISTSHNGTPSPTASLATQGSAQSSGASADAAAQAAATRLSGMLKQSGAYHSDVNAAVGDVQSCQRLRTARSAFGASAGNRQNLLNELRTLPGRATLPASLLQELTGAWQSSVQVDNDLHDWAQDEISGGCDPKKVADDSHYKASLGPDGTATSDKQAFAKDWAPIARKYGLPAYTGAQI